MKKDCGPATTSVRVAINPRLIDPTKSARRELPGGRQLPRRPCPPGQEAVVLQAGLAVGERLAVEAKDMAASGFKHRLAGGGVPFHRRTETRVEIRFARREHAELECAAAFHTIEHRLALEIFGE